MVSSKCARQLANEGKEAMVPLEDDKPTVIALREIAEKKIDLIKTWESIVNASQKYQPVEETDIDDDQTVPMNENASQVSFDNFEKENASEKKRKKIYMTQNEIQKLISQKKNNSDESESTEVEDSPNLKEEIE